MRELMALIAWCWDWMQGCTHPNMSWPVQLRVEGELQRATVCCMNCARVWEYDFAEMRRGKQLQGESEGGKVTAC